HNQMSAGLIPDLTAFRDKLPAGSERDQGDAMIAEITKLTSADESGLARQVGEAQGAAPRTQLAAPGPAAAPPKVDAVPSVGPPLRAAAARAVRPADARRLADADITPAGAIQRRGSALLDDKAAGLTAAQHVQLLDALTDATYGAGLLTERERAAADNVLHDLA